MLTNMHKIANGVKEKGKIQQIPLVSNGKTSQMACKRRYILSSLTCVRMHTAPGRCPARFMDDRIANRENFATFKGKQAMVVVPPTEFRA